MKKRGQFYLITTVIIIALIASLATLSNYVQKKSSINFYYTKDELKIESEKVLDYGISNGKDLKSLLTDFTHNYSEYSHAENLYFIFGDNTEITVAGIKKLSSGIINITTSTGQKDLVLIKGIYDSTDITTPGNSVNLTVDENKYDFILQQGENFYFIIFKEIEGKKYITTNI